MKLKYLPEWVYPAIINSDNRESLLTCFDELNKIEKIDLIQSKEDNTIFQFTTNNRNIVSLFDFILRGIRDPFTGQKHRQGIIGRPADIFIPNSINDTRFIFEESELIDNGDEIFTWFTTYCFNLISFKSDGDNVIFSFKRTL